MQISSGTFVFYRPPPPRHSYQKSLKRLEYFSRHIVHKIYDCPIYCWIAEGSVRISHQQSKPYHILYMEFRDNTGASRYRSFQFSSLNETLTWMDTQAHNIPLEAICPTATSKNPMHHSQVAKQSHAKTTEDPEAA